MSIISTIKKHTRWFLHSSGMVLIVVAVWGTLIATNQLAPNQWLMGYDNLLPELNLSLWWERDFYSVWQDYRGLGVANTVVDGTELTRLPFVWLISAIFTPRLVRWTWVAAMLLLGSVSTFFLVANWCQLGFASATKKISPAVFKFAALIASLFYLLCPATIQLFYTPLESFSSWYGFLPLLLWLFLRYLRTCTPKNLLLFSLACVLASSAFHLETIYVVCVMTIVIVALGWLPHQRPHKYLPRIGWALLALIVTQLYWLIPLAITTISHSNDFTTTKQNEIATPQVQEMSYTRGNLTNIALQHGYWFDYREYNPHNHTYTAYLGDWADWWQQPWNQISGWVLFILAAIGFGLALLLAKRRSFAVSQLAVFVLGVFMLTGGRGWLLGLPFRLLSFLPLIKDIFRVSFTKWSTVASLGFALGLALFVIGATVITKKYFRPAWRRIILGATIGIIIIALASRCLPVFSGRLFGWQGQWEFPQRYFALAEFMANQNPQGTTVHLPQPNYWGWLFYDWGYRGSGFLWQMIPQPLLDRNFDAWSLTNQDSYQELNLAVQKNDSQLLQQLAQKYHLTYAIVDESLMAAGDNNWQRRQEQNQQLKQLLQNANAQEIWHQEGLSVWQLSSEASTSPLQLTTEFTPTSTLAQGSTQDNLYLTVGNYLTPTPDHSSTTIYPFATSNQERLESVNCEATSCHLQTDLPTNHQGYRVLVPALTTSEPVVVNGSAWLTDEQTLQISFAPNLSLSWDDAIHDLANLAPLALTNLATSTAGAILDFGDQRPYLVESQAITDFTTTLVAGEPLTIRAFPAHAATTSASGEMSVASNLVRQFNYPATIWQSLLQEQIFTIPATAAALTVSWESPAYSLALSSQPGLSCDVTGRGRVHKEMLPTGGARYQVANFGSLCESYHLQHLDPRNQYLMMVEAQNLTGQSLRFAIVDENTNQQLLTHRLNTNPTQYFYLPTATQGTTNYNLFFYLTAASYGQESVNVLSRLRFLQYPHLSLSQIKLVPTTTSLTESEPKPNSNQTLTSITNNHRWSYRAQVAGNTRVTTPTALVLARAYDPYWRARIKVAGKWQTLTNARWNTWANAWQLPVTTSIEEIEVQYWPQQIVKWGLIALLGWLVTLGVLASGLVTRLWPHSRAKIKRLFH